MQVDLNSKCPSVCATTREITRMSS